MNFKEILELIDKVADRGIAAVEIEQRFRNSQPKTKPSKSSGNRTFALMKRLEDSELPFRRDANAGVANFEDKFPIFVR